jgi:Domain of unknown function (DUF4430)
VFRRSLSVAAVVALALSLAAPSLATTVHLRVEGLTQTLFDGDVSTSPHALMGHVCDGTNGGANAAPGATMTGALDDAGVSWAGTWFDSFQDFSIDRVGGDAADVASGRFWGLLLNGKQTDVGGCQQRVADGDEVLFAYDLFQKAHVLRLSTSTTSVQAGQPVALAVVDSETGSPVEAASVAMTTTGPDGRATAGVSGSGLVHSQSREGRQHSLERGHHLRLRRERRRLRRTSGFACQPALAAASAARFAASAPVGSFRLGRSASSRVVLRADRGALPPPHRRKQARPSSSREP